MEVDSKWFDRRGNINLEPIGSRDTDHVNDALFTAQYRLLVSHFTGISPRILMGSQILDNRDSHDNKTGDVCLYERAGIRHYLPAHKLLLGRRWYHPRDLALYASNKYPYLSWLLMPIVDVSNILSCYKTWKKKPNGTKELTTSGKLLALTRCLGFRRYKTLKVCTWLIRRNEMFRSWENIALIYYKYPDHPIVELCQKLDKEWN